MKIINPDIAFSADQRAELLAEVFPAMTRRERVLELMESADADTREALRPEFEQLNEAIREGWKAYQSGLPILELSRCPFTGEVWSHSLDPYGIDGFWWNCYKPIRRLDEPLGGRFYAFRGAMRPPDEPPLVPFLVEPGPDLPFIIERLMRFPSITAVISHVSIGGMDAYPIVYFSSADLPNESRTNDWGRDAYSFRGIQGNYEERQYFDAEDEFLFNLEPWLNQQRVLWIAPGDEALTLRRGVADCPYVQLQGKRAVWRTKAGRLWWGPPGKS